MRTEFGRSNACSLCMSTTHQHKVILAALAKKIKKLSIQTLFPQQQEKTQDLQKQGFARLIKALKLLREPQKPYYQPCEHPFWLKRFKKFLACSSKKLDYLCHLAANIVSQKSYHFSLLETQVKNSMSTSCRLVNDGQPKTAKIKIQDEDHKNKIFLKSQVQEIKVKEENGIRVTQMKGHASFSTLHDYGSFIFDTGMGLWYQGTFFGDHHSPKQ